MFTTGGNIINFGGYLSDPAVGTYLYKYGKETGQAYCEVTDIGASTWDYENNIIIGSNRSKDNFGSQ